MKILVIMKRFGANKDMVMQNFGRQIRLFEPLAKKHSIDFLCPDYIKNENKIITRSGIRFIIKPVSFFSIIGFVLYTKNLIKKERYDIIVATTDPIIGIINYLYSKKSKIPLIYDLQDNFETYDTYKIPFVDFLHKRVLKYADVIITVSESLKKYISKIRRKPIYVIQNGIDLKLFRVIDKITARKKLRLPLNAKIIVFIGSLERLKGFDIMIEAFNNVRKKHPNAYLLLSGKIDKDVNIGQTNIIFREFPKREEVVLGINASDVAILPNPINEFTKFCFPYKIVEYMACNVPIVATDVGDVSILLKKYKGSLCKPDVTDLSEKILEKLEDEQKVDYSKDVKNFKWEILADKLDKIIVTLQKQ